MAETHELRLKIDAGAAKSGARDFTAAIEAVKRAVRDLERDSTGAFTKLKKNITEASSMGKVKFGVDRQSLRDLDSFANKQAQIVKSSQASTKTLTTLIGKVRGLSDAYGIASRTSNDFAASILKTNSALMRQIQLASQARSAVRQVRTAPTASLPEASPVPRSGRVSQAQLTAVSRALRAVGKEATAAGAAVDKSMSNLARFSNLVLRSQTQANAAVTKGANLQLSAASAIRTAEAQAARLVGQLQRMGDTRGASSMSQALIRLKANLSGGVESAVQLRRFTDQFASAANAARISVTRYSEAQMAAAASSRRLAAEQASVAASARRVEAEMRSVAGATHAKEAAMRRATGGMRGLENAFSSTYQAGTLFRNMLGSITFGTFIASVFQAGDAMEQFRVTMEVASGSAAGAFREMDYIDGLAGRLGIGLQGARDNYSKFAISADLAGISAETTQHIFESVATAMSVLGKSTYDQNLAFLALEQMMSKGNVSSEELRRQLGERMPGAVNMMAQALGVTTKELNEMLKAGEVLSADALPKFADVVMANFGPGLEAATKRAGFNLGNLRNEFLKFMEGIAQAGFMQELAFQFARLTNVLRSGEAAGAARKLGEALANMARFAGDAVIFLIENLETVGTVIKAIAIGAAAKQIGFFTAAIATGAFQLVGYADAALKARAASTAAAAATTASTTATTANTVALGLNAKGVAASARGQALLQAALARSAASAAAATASNGFLARSMTFLTGATAKATGALGLFARGLMFLAPWAGIVVAGLMLIPGAMNMVGLGANQMYTAVDAAISRSGVRFEELGDVISDTASNTAIAAIIADLDALDNRLQDFVSRNQTRSQGLTLGAGIASGMNYEDISDTGFRGGFIGDFFMDRQMRGAMGQSGISPEAIESMGTASKRAFVDLYKMFQEMERGTITAAQFNEEVANAMIRNPLDAGVLRAFQTASKELLQAELAAVAFNKRMVELKGTDAEKTLMGFANSATAFVRTGTGLEALQRQMESLKEESPALAAQLETIFTRAQDAFGKGTDSKVFDAQILEVYAQRIIDIREEMSATADAAAAGWGQARTQLESTLDVLDGGRGRRGALIDDAEIERIRALFAAFEQSDGISLTAARMRELAESVAAPSAEMEAFKTRALAQFATVESGLQTYTEWSNTLDTLSANFADPAMLEYVERLRQAGNETGRVVMTASQLEDALADMGLSGTDAAVALIAAARNAEQLAQDSHAAANASYEVAGGMDVIMSAAYGARDGVMAVMGSLRQLFSLSGSIMSSAMSMAADMQESIRITTLEGADKARAQFFHRGEGRTFVDEQTEKIQELRTQAESATSWTDRLRLSAEATAAELALGTGKAMLGNLAEQEFNAQQAERDGNRRGGGGGGRGRKRSKEELQTIAELNEEMSEQLDKLKEQELASRALIDGTVMSEEAARRLAEAQMISGGAVDENTMAMIRQIDAAERLNEQLSKAARDPVKEWLDSVPTWVEAGNQIEAEAIGHVRDSLAEFIKTGKMDFESLGESILGTVADIVADKAMKELVTLLTGGDGASTGGLLGKIFSSIGDFGGGGGGGGGGGFWGMITSGIGALFGAGSEGGYSGSLPGRQFMPYSSFRHAPHYAEGTANTSGIPAVLHDNEAVIPLSKGRKIPVEMPEGGSGGGATVINNTFNISTPDADSFRRSQKQIAADMASAGQRAMSQNR